MDQSSSIEHKFLVLGVHGAAGLSSELEPCGRTTQRFTQPSSYCWLVPEDGFRANWFIFEPLANPRVSHQALRPERPENRTGSSQCRAGSGTRQAARAPVSSSAHRPSMSASNGSHNHHKNCQKVQLDDIVPIFRLDSAALLLDQAPLSYLFIWSR